jgi:hypothetical protein
MKGSLPAAEMRSSMDRIRRFAEAEYVVAAASLARGKLS